MRWCDDTVFIGIYQCFFIDSIIAPEDKDNPLSLFWEERYSAIGEGFPSFSLVRSGLSLPHGEYRIEEEDSLPCPITQIRLDSLDAEVTCQFFEDIFEAWLCFGTVWDRERKSHGSTRGMVGILPEDDHFHIFKRGHIECPEDVFPWRKTHFLRIFAFYKFGEILPVRHLKISRKYSLPRWMDSHSHVSII